jgi:hypothetical protein
MTNKKKIAADLHSALSGQNPLSIDLYVEGLADQKLSSKHRRTRTLTCLQVQLRNRGRA